MAQKKSNLTKVQDSNIKGNAYFLSLELEQVRCFRKKQIADFSDGCGNPRQWNIILGNNGTGKTTILQSLATQNIPDLTILFRNYAVIQRNKKLMDESNFTEQIKELKDPDMDYKKELIWFENATNNLIQYLTNNSSLKSHIYSLYSRLLNNEKAKSKSHLSIPCVATSIKTIQNLTKNNTGKVLSSYKEPKTIKLSELYYLQPDKKIASSENFELSQGFQNLLMFGYGASRKAGETSLSEQNQENLVITLFDESAFLLNPEEWLLQADYFVSRSSAKKSKENFNRVKDILINVLPNVDEIKISERKDKEKSFPSPIVEFHTPYGWVEAKDLSLGYRTSMAWIVDFASRMFDLYPESENPLAEPAVVLIDEIDLHLHPKWQRELLDYLSNLFLNTQFIVTTHSPLIVQSAVARDANIVVCRREGNHVVIDQSVEAVRNWRADQILTSDLFGLETARPKEIEPLLEEREKILSKAKLTKKDEKRLTELENEIGVMPVSENPEDDKAMDIIRRAAERLESQK